MYASLEDLARPLGEMLVAPGPQHPACLASEVAKAWSCITASDACSALCIQYGRNKLLQHPYYVYGSVITEEQAVNSEPFFCDAK